MADTILWVHDEMLSPDWLQADRPAVFVFDEAWINTQRLSLKRVVFMYDCLLEIPGVEIRKGNVVAAVKEFAAEHSAATIETAATADPRLKRQITELGAATISTEPFVDLPADTDLKRFSRYWRKAEKRVLNRQR